MPRLLANATPESSYASAWTFWKVARKKATIRKVENCILDWLLKFSEKRECTRSEALGEKLKEGQVRIKVTATKRLELTMSTPPDQIFQFSSHGQMSGSQKKIL